MKKIIGILGIAVIAVTMFFSANAVNGSNSDTNLASLIVMSTANAEPGDDGGLRGTLIHGTCTRGVPSYVCSCSTVPMIEVPGRDAKCLGSVGLCVPIRCN